MKASGFLLARAARFTQGLPITIWLLAHFANIAGSADGDHDKLLIGLFRLEIGRPSPPYGWEAEPLRHLLNAYAARLSDTPERRLLDLVCLFDRPGAYTALDELVRDVECQAHLLGNWRKLSAADWSAAAGRLIRSGLVEEEEQRALGMHPLVQAHYA